MSDLHLKHAMHMHYKKKSAQSKADDDALECLQSY